ncbi:hypothetical protein AHAS_Ahas17G0166400 [Arachis hypogaea]
MAANLGVITGKHLAEHSRNEYPWATNFILWFIAEIAIVACDIPEVIGTAFALNMLFSIPVWIGVLLTGLNTLVTKRKRCYWSRDFTPRGYGYVVRSPCLLQPFDFSFLLKCILKLCFFVNSADYPVYHSLYDDFIWMQNFGDPMFHRHVAAASVWGLVALWLADEEFLPFDYQSYAKELQLNVKNLEDEISNKDMNLSPILKSIKELEKAAIKINDQRKEIEASKGWRTWKEYQMKVRDVNDRLMMAERAFTDRDGLLGMTWHNHLGSNF